ncbi:MAG: hypothetical protein EOO65_01065, partial [Methanosarcinales archaeon]
MHVIHTACRVQQAGYSCHFPLTTWTSATHVTCKIDFAQCTQLVEAQPATLTLVSSVGDVLPTSSALNLIVLPRPELVPASFQTVHMLANGARAVAAPIPLVTHVSWEPTSTGDCKSLNLVHTQFLCAWMAELEDLPSPNSMVQLAAVSHARVTQNCSVVCPLPILDFSTRGGKAMRYSTWLTLDAAREQFFPWSSAQETMGVHVYAAPRVLGASPAVITTDGGAVVLDVHPPLPTHLLSHNNVQCIVDDRYSVSTHVGCAGACVECRAPWLLFASNSSLYRDGMATLTMRLGLGTSGHAPLHTNAIMIYAAAAIGARARVLTFPQLLVTGTDVHFQVSTALTTSLLQHAACVYVPHARCAPAGHTDELRVPVRTRVRPQNDSTSPVLWTCAVPAQLAGLAHAPCPCSVHVETQHGERFEAGANVSILTNVRAFVIEPSPFVVADAWTHFVLDTGEALAARGSWRCVGGHGAAARAYADDSEHATASRQQCFARVLASAADSMQCPLQLCLDSTSACACVPLRVHAFSGPTPVLPHQLIAGSEARISLPTRSMMDGVTMSDACFVWQAQSMWTASVHCTRVECYCTLPSGALHHGSSMPTHVAVAPITTPEQYWPLLRSTYAVERPVLMQGASATLRTRAVTDLSKGAVDVHVRGISLGLPLTCSLASSMLEATFNVSAEWLSDELVRCRALASMRPGLYDITLASNGAPLVPVDGRLHVVPSALMSRVHPQWVNVLEGRALPCHTVHGRGFPEHVAYLCELTVQGGSTLQAAASWLSTKELRCCFDVPLPAGVHAFQVRVGDGSRVLVDGGANDLHITAANVSFVSAEHVLQVSAQSGDAQLAARTNVPLVWSRASCAAGGVRTDAVVETLRSGSTVLSCAWQRLARRQVAGLVAGARSVSICSADVEYAQQCLFLSAVVRHRQSVLSTEERIIVHPHTTDETGGTLIT